jgi:hypothetical protein
MATTYEAIATVTVGSGGAANIEFTSIPATYTDLLLKLSLRCSASGSVGRRTQLRFNGAANDNNLTFRRLYSDGNTAGSDSGSTGHVAWMPDASATANTFSNIEVYIPNYAGSNNKSFSADGVMENNASTNYWGLFADLWSNSAAINAIKIYEVDGNNLGQYSTATLYGIRSS